ncbi:hypothetical protein KDX27_05935 [Burkholderia cenocepacia]|uniref:hypothetical protein n=1 Tax=Burkholderia TaxID=32008 RepID=UPI000A772FB3|nr:MULTISPECIES: hypothetical protein [Burkholderia]MBN3527816.1 hypothetical protein [Burkholderia cenocepacia]MBR7901859.1 hypothetical protein [Burkholderia cenocepacia]MBR8022522.1 hypothetical protein [Burkholderia cenocepacia]MBR8167246.1 hypothetical protein [Burkholderia cenocepacia]MBR8421393.1 hypothetical protein [Burkholderia cenocepacia]
MAPLRDAAHRAMAASGHVLATREQSRCRIGAYRAALARTAMPHDDSAAAHHICASVHRDGERVARRGDVPDTRCALCGGVPGAIDADMARRLH